MTDDNAADRSPGPARTPDPVLARLDRLIGTWQVDGRDFGSEGEPTGGEIHGRVTFAWLEGGFFLVQHVDLDHDGRRVKGIEVIGRERPFGSDRASAEIRSRVYDNAGNTLDYVYELDGDALTIWGGQVGSPAHFEGIFGDDGNRLAGRWEWPGGGDEATMTRVEYAGRFADASARWTIAAHGVGKAEIDRRPGVGANTVGT